MLSFVVTTVTTIFLTRIGFYLSARIGLEIIYLSSILSVMAEIGRNCAISAFCCLGMDWYWAGDE